MCDPPFDHALLDGGTATFDVHWSPVCEVCGEATTVAVIDARMIEPRVGADGSLWARWVPNGPTHHFCDAHERPPVHMSLTDDKVMEFVVEARQKDK